MQTLLPYPDFAQSAATLDRQRLGKQRVECLQIVKTLLVGAGWQNHPAVKMWRGYEIALLDYQLAVCDEWAVVREYEDTCAEKTIALFEEHEYHPQALANFFETGNYESPPWLGDPAFHESHRSRLMVKNFQHYGPLFAADTRRDLPYVWPVQ